MSEETLSELANRLLGALRQTPDKLVRRSELAQRVGKRQLNARDVAALDFLVEMGRVEKVRVDDPRPVGYRFEYRAV